MVIEGAHGRPPLVHNKYYVRVNHSGSDHSYIFDQVAVRFGIEYGSVPGLQMVKLSYHDDGQRSSLSHVPMAFTA
jgi:hypothetical protein